MITDLQDLTDLLNSQQQDTPTAVKREEGANSIMENLYADISQAKMELAAANGSCISSTPYNTRNSCWESGSSSSATSSQA